MSDDLPRSLDGARAAADDPGEPSGRKPAGPVPKVAAIVPTYNAAPFVLDTLASALAQDYPNLEIVVVDDGSSDATREVVSGVEPQVRLVDGPRRGVSAARNFGIRQTDAEWIAFLDHDDRWEPDKIRRQVEIMAGDPGVGLVFTQAQVVEDGRPGKVFPEIENPEAFLERAHEELLHWNFVPVSSVLVRRSALPPHGSGGRDGEGVEGPFDPGLKLSEDWDLWLRMAPRGAFRFIPEPLTTYTIVPGRATERLADLRLEDIEVFRRQLAAHPAFVERDPVRCRETLWRLHEEAGYWLLREGRTAEARRRFLDAWRMRPLRPKPLAFVAASWFGWRPRTDVPP